ncbi:MAG: hypothetical protein NVSMB9_31340 [Isosphaeraceae bacterium]
MSTGEKRGVHLAGEGDRIATGFEHEVPAEAEEGYQSGLLPIEPRTAERPAPGIENDRAETIKLVPPGMASHGPLTTSSEGPARMSRSRAPEAAALASSGNRLRTPEETLLDLVRLLHHLGEPRTWSPVERALVVATRAAFEQLSVECAHLLEAVTPRLPGSGAHGSPVSGGQSGHAHNPLKTRSPGKAPQKGNVKAPARSSGTEKK